ncbi:hypothetical protein [Holospora elegans]|nr:hypothetical protein [Holospora elegans]
MVDQKKKIDLEKLEAYVKKTQDMTLKKAAQEFWGQSLLVKKIRLVA